MTGHEPTVQLKSSTLCSKEELHRFRKLVLEAGEVEKAGLDGRIARAEALAFLQLGAETIGVGALKIPNPGYAPKLFRKANASSEARAFGLELGWVVIDGDYRGRSFSRRIVEALVDRAGGKKIYATSVTTRVPMHRALVAWGLREKASNGNRNVARKKNCLCSFIPPAPKNSHHITFRLQELAGERQECSARMLLSSARVRGDL